MTAPSRRREPRVITIAEIEQRFELASYWSDGLWCPAVARREEGGYGIRLVRPAAGRRRNSSYMYFHLDEDGTVTSAPVGYTRDYRPGRVVDVEAAVERFATPPADEGEGGNPTGGEPS